MTRTRKLALCMSLVAVVGGVHLAGGLREAIAGLSCPVVSTDTTFATTGLQNNCATSPMPCTTKTGTNYDTASAAIVIPASAGNFQSPAGAAITKNVYFAAAGDFDKDGWDDFIAADNADQIYMMRNQTITCGKSPSGSTTSNPAYYPCSGAKSGPVAPSVQNIPDNDTWWNTLTNVRPSSFQSPNSLDSSGAESGAQCNNNLDDDGDGVVNDGCPTVNAGAGAETSCNDAVDNDNDGRINDGCSASGAAESGAQCANNTNDDGDSRVNDGCPTYNGSESNLAWPANACSNDTDDDGDGKVNDGCPTAGSAASAKPIKPAGGSGTACGGGRCTPMIGADFDGDGWTDFAAISLAYPKDSKQWPTAARLYLNTQNCHKTSDTTGQWTPCGIGMTCSGQPANGACTGAGLTKGTALSESNLSCLGTTGNSANCPYNFATFAAYDLKTGAATSANTGSSDTSPTTTTPGDFGPLVHPTTNMAALDWDGDGDIDILYGHDEGTCPSGFCSTSGQVFHIGIDVWLNDCNAHYLPGTTSCAGHIPKFTHSTTGKAMTSGAQSSAQNAPGVLIPSTARNNSTILPNSDLGFDVDGHKSPAFVYEDVNGDGKRDLVLGSPGCCNGSGTQNRRLRIFKGTGAGQNTACTSLPASPCSFTHTLDTANPLSLSTSDSSGTIYDGFEGAMTGLFVHDFSLDGYPDLITASDGYSWSGSIGGRTRYWKNTGSSANPFGTNWPSCSANTATCSDCSASCNPEPTTHISESCGSAATCPAGSTALNPPQFPDFDMTFMIDYDHDPQRTKDPVISNGNTANEFYIFPNRASPTVYAGCGTVASGTLAAPTSEATISGACITPSATVPNNTGINWYLSNDGGGSWSLACLQLSSGFTPALVNGQCCVTFADITGRDIQWKAELDSYVTDRLTAPCTNPSTPPGVACGVGAPYGCARTGSATPTITSVAANYTYTLAQQHYKAGVIVSDGVSYVGSFTQPGNRGYMYAISADFGTQYFNFGTKLDAQSTRNLYTSSTLTTSPTKVTLSVANAADTTLQARIGATSTTEAQNALTWFTGARFGIENSGFAETKLGAVVGSTPAIIQKPFRPSFYTYLSTTDRSLYDTFASNQSTRIPLLLFGAMDGVLHAVYAISTSIADTRNGTEAWGFVPPYVASTIKGDYLASCTPTCAAGSLLVTSYPDGSPTLADIKKSNGTIATVALIADGNGGSSLTALDVTQTVTATSSTTNTVAGPTPLWAAQPGDSAAGFATSKPAVARVKIGGAEKFIVVAGTGVNNTDNTKGKIVSGYDLETGALLWKFELACALTSDITLFETDDGGEDGAPTIDGYIDRAVFADSCGNVYKINPGQDLSAATPQYWMGNDASSYGPVANSLGASNGVTRRALFKTSSQLAVAGDNGERPITNTIGARADTSTDIVLFFGTGGVETFDASKRNAFFAIYAKDGTLRSGSAGRIDGTCTAGKCDKFYGGVVVSTDTVYLLRSKDAVIGSVGSCDYGTTALEAYGLTSLASTFTVDQIGGQAIAASAGPLYGDAGALYFATVTGQVKRVGQPRAATAGADSAAGTLNNLGANEFVNGSSPFTLIGWRVVL